LFTYFLLYIHIYSILSLQGIPVHNIKGDLELRSVDFAYQMRPSHKVRITVWVIVVSTVIIIIVVIKIIVIIIMVIVAQNWDSWYEDI